LLTSCISKDQYNSQIQENQKLKDQIRQMEADSVHSLQNNELLLSLAYDDYTDGYYESSTKICNQILDKYSVTKEACDLRSKMEAPKIKIVYKNHPPTILKSPDKVSDSPKKIPDVIDLTDTIPEIPKIGVIDTSLQNESKPKTERTYYKGSRGGCYYLTSGGNKKYVDRGLCE
jgi:hypothetical protein